MNCNPQSLPKDWDSGLEEFLKAPMVSAIRLSNIPWSEQTIDRVMDTKTLIEAINVTPLKEKSIVYRENPLLVRTKRVNHLINAPLSPRKPIIIPCSHRTVNQRDKQRIEKIFRQRNKLSSSQISSDISTTENSPSKLPQLSSNSESVVSNRSGTSIGKNLVRPFPITNLRHSSLQTRNPLLFKF